MDFQATTLFKHRGYNTSLDVADKLEDYLAYSAKHDGSDTGHSLTMGDDSADVVARGKGTSVWHASANPDGTIARG